MNATPSSSSRQVVRIGIVACAATVLLICGQFDLSVGSIVGFTGMLVAICAAPTDSTKSALAFGMPLALALVIGFAGALFIGLINAICVTGLRINALITTLGTLAIFRGLTEVLGNGQTIRLDGFGAIGVGTFLGIPIPVYIFAVVVVAFHFTLRYTTYGRSMYAIGANPTAARLAGIRTNRAVFIGFMLSADLCRAGRADPAVAGRRRAATRCRDWSSPS